MNIYDISICVAKCALLECGIKLYFSQEVTHFDEAIHK